MALPVQNAQADQMVQLLAGSGGAAPGRPGTGPGAGGPPPTGTAKALADASSMLDGANPQGAISVLSQMGKDLAQLYLSSAMTMPDATKDIDTARQALQRAIKTYQKAAATQAAVQPIVNQAGIGPITPAPAAPGPDISALLGIQ